MVETIGICETHLLPLDERGECELCRLSDMPSKAPRARSAWWALIIPVTILLAGALWAYIAVLSDDGAPAAQGVQPVVPVTEPATPAAPEPQAPAPERLPPRSSPPSPEEIPTPANFQQ
jgi:hypothetical protein